MKFRKIMFVTAIALAQSLVAAHAGADDNSNAPASTEESRPQFTVKGHVPKLNIRWDCGACAPNEKVIPLILENYAAIARRNSFAVADVAIDVFRQRNPGMRVMFGVMAGKDKLGVKVSYKGKEFIAEDYFANTMMGMNALCESIAARMYKKLAEPSK